MRDSLLQDLRYTFRTLARNPGFTVFAVLIVGLGIGASATVFSIVNALLLRPLPFRDPSRLVWMINHDTSGLSGQTTQIGHLLDLREKNKSFEDLGGYMAFYGVGDDKLTGQGEPERVSAVPVAENFFQVLGVQPEIGRLFTHEECLDNGPKAVLLSHGLWERRFGSDPGVVGKPLTINDEAVSVIGVMPATFDFSSVFAPGSHVDLYSPFPLNDRTNRWGNTMAIVGRLKPGVTLARAREETRILAGQITAAHPERNTFEGKLSMLQEHVSGRIRPALWVLAAAVGAVMLIVCANLSNLLLGKMAARQKEIAIRTALGAGRWRLIRQMLTESITLAFCGSALGIVLAFAGVRALARLDSMKIPLLQNVQLDGVALAFTLLMALLTGLVFGLAPALHTSTGALHESLKDSGRGSTDSKKRSWIRGALVVSEIAFACVLLVGAGLLIRSFLRVLDVNLGFHPERAIAIRVDPSSLYKTKEQKAGYFDEVLRRVRDIAGVEAVGLTDTLPLGRNRGWGAGEKGHVYPRGKYPSAFPRMVTEGYFAAMGIPLRAGREINEHDALTSEPVIVINETMARTLFESADPLGRIIRACGERRVVGVVGDVRHLALEEASGNEMYLPIRQCQDFPSVDAVVRTSLSPTAMAKDVRNALRPIEPSLPGNEFRALQQLVDRSVSPRRFLVLLLAGFALFALVLASLGIYAVISYNVSQRTQEIGIRMALGASAGHLQMRVLTETLSLAVTGMFIGMAASWALARSLNTLLFGVTANDPATFLGMLGVIFAVSALAGYIPARRASRIDPMVALRAA